MNRQSKVRGELGSDEKLIALVDFVIGTPL